MPLQLSELFTGGLAALAGNSVPNLNLKSTAVDVGAIDQGIAGGVLEQAKLDQQKQQLANALLIAQMQQDEQNKRAMLSAQVTMGEGAANRGNARGIADQRTGLGYDQLKQTAKSDQAKQSMEAQKFDLDTWYKTTGIAQEDQKILETHMKNEFDSKMKQDEFSLKKTSQIFGSYLLAQQNTQNPEDLKQAQDMVLKMGVENNTLSQDQADKLSKLSTEQFGFYAGTQTEVTKSALKAKGMGLSITTNPDGTTTITQGETKPTQNAAQADVSNTMTQLGQFEQISNDYADNYLTYGGAIESGVGNTLSKMGMSMGKEYQDFASNRSGFQAQLKRFAFEFVKAMSGVQYSDKQLQALQEAVINGEDSPATFKGKMKSLLNFMRSNLLAKQGMLKNGIPLNNQDEFNTRADAILQTLNGTTDEQQ